jgi:sugar phosphate isomerase/epimerase
MKATAACSTSIGSDRPLAEALARLAARGAQEIDLLCIEGWAHVNPSALAERFDAEAARIESALAAQGLRVTALNTMSGAPLHRRDPGMRERRARENAALLALMKRWKIGAAALQPPLRRGAPWSKAEQEETMVSVREEVERAEHAGRCFALELHVDSPFETPRQVASLLAAWPEVPLVYDPAHLIAQGVPLRSTERLLRQAKLVHLRDAAPGRLQVSFGTGALDLDWVLDGLRDRGFAGHVSIEYLGGMGAAFDLDDSVRRLRDRVRQALS